MGLTHCPLCMGLAVLCAVRFSAHALMLWQLRPVAAKGGAARTLDTRLRLA